jgi:hypothetical protein
VAFDFFPVREGALQDENVHFRGQIDDVLTIIRIAGNGHGSAILELNPIPDTFSDMGHGF